jgi:hypothetical protein
MLSSADTERLTDAIATLAMLEKASRREVLTAHEDAIDVLGYGMFTEACHAANAAVHNVLAVAGAWLESDNARAALAVDDEAQE